MFYFVDNNEDHNSSYYNLLPDWNHYLEAKVKEAFKNMN